VTGATRRGSTALYTDLIWPGRDSAGSAPTLPRRQLAGAWAPGSYLASADLRWRLVRAEICPAGECAWARSQQVDAAAARSYGRVPVRRPRLQGLSQGLSTCGTSLWNCHDQTHCESTRAEQQAQV